MDRTPIGRITGRSVTELRFRIGPDEPVRLGELLVVSAGRSLDADFYLRVTDLEYGADDGDQRWEERTAGALMSAPEDLVLYDRDERLYKTAVAAPLGFLADGRFRKPKTLPDHFAEVSRPVAGDFAFLRRAADDMELGFLRSGDEPTEDRLGISPGALAQHIGIFATTGMGKSNLLKVLAGSCLESGKVGLLVLDPHGEYADGGGGQHPDGTAHRGLLHHPQGDRLVVYTSRPILGAEGRSHDLAIAASEIEVWDFRAVYGTSEAQEEALFAARQKWGNDWLVHVGNTDPEQLFAVFGEKFHRGTWNVLSRRCENILRQPVVHSDSTARSTTTAILDHLESGHTVLVDTSALDPQEELLLSATLARKLLRKMQQLYRKPEEFRKHPPTCILLEEAQRVLNARGGSDNVFAQIAREGRKFRVGLGAVTQQPRLISDELLSQFNTQIILGLADPTDRDRVKSGARQDLSQVVKEIQMLEPGEALITTPGAPFALPLKAHLYEDRLKELGPARVEAKKAVDDGFY